MGVLAMVAMGHAGALLAQSASPSDAGPKPVPAPVPAPVPRALYSPAAPQGNPEDSPEPTVGAATGPISQPPMTAAQRALWLELSARSRQLDATAAANTAKARVLAALEARLDDRVKQLDALQKQLAAEDAARQSVQDQNWSGLVKIYGTMRPQDAATILNDLPMPVLLPVMDHMPDRKAAAILAAMDPNKARDVTLALAQYRVSHPPAHADTGH